MTPIPGFPQHFLDEHAQWHHDQADRMDRPGYGSDFLNFHRDFTSRVLAWYGQQGLDAAAVQPWTGVPEPLKANGSWPGRLAEAEARVSTRPYVFRDDDALGLFLDSRNPQGLHGWVHGRAASVFGDSIFADFHTSPRSTLFYNWHGLIERWRMQAQQSWRWPRKIDWDQLLAAERLPDGDRIVATIEDNALPEDPSAEAAVEFVLASALWWWKELNVPDGETGSSWDIHTGARWNGGRRFSDRVALWAHQVNNGQVLTFRKAKTFGLVSSTYQLGGLERLAPRTRVTLTWLAD